MPPSPSVTHIPAWKRLGLKLKSAEAPSTESHGAHKKINGAPSGGLNGVEHGKKRKSLSEQTGDSSIKKQKREQIPNKAKPLNSEKTGIKARTDTRKPSKPVTGKTVKEKPRKGVSFAEGTKENDGADDPEAASETEKVPLTPEQRKAEKRKKREQRNRNLPDPNRAAEQPSASSTRLLDYLWTYQNSRSNWKFQKNRETAILKNVLSPEKIPTSHDLPLFTYLSSLKSAASKDRVAEAAKEAIKADVEDKDNEAADYKQMVSSFRANLVESKEDALRAQEAEESSLNMTQQKNLSKRKRAEMVYLAVSGVIFEDIKPALTKAEKELKLKERAKAKAKGRKVRVAAVEDDSTSSSGSSDSDSDSESESGNESTNGNEKPKGAKSTAEDSSSSETSSDSSSADSSPDESSSSDSE